MCKNVGLVKFYEIIGAVWCYTFFHVLNIVSEIETKVEKS